MNIIVSNQSELPIYVQIKEQIKEQIMSGQIPEDSLLPSIRELARDASVSVITTTKAYSELEKEGFIHTKQGIGSIVLPRDNSMIKEQYLKKIEASFMTAIECARIAGISDEELQDVLKTLLKE